MQLTHPFIAISIGAVIALSPVGTASAQTTSSDSSNSPTNSRTANVADSSPPEITSLELAKSDPSDKPELSDVEAIASDSESQSESTSEAQAGEAVSEAEAVSQSTQPPPESLPLPGAPSQPTPDAGEATEETNTTPAPTPEPLPLPGAETAPAPTELESTDPPELTTTEEITDAAPEYLNPDPNPLSFPTQPEEVELVGTQPITLAQALELAQRNSPELQVAQQQVELARAQLREARAANAPTLQLSSGLTFSENQSQGQTDLVGQPVGNQDDINATLSGTVQANYELFTSGRRSANIRASEGQVRFQELQLETVAEQLRLDVANDYYDLQEADEQVRISQAALEEAERSLRDAEALERAGVGTRFDVLQAQVDVANSQQELTQNISQQQISRRQLAQQLNLAQSVNVVAADPVQVAAPWTLTLEESIVLAFRNRAELEQQLVQREVSDEQRRAALAELGPQISLFAEYSVSDLLNDSGSSSTGGDNGFNDTYQFGAQFNLTLFDGGAARARADQQEANIEIAESQFTDARNQVRFEVEQAYSSLQANAENIETTTLALQQATEALRLARLRFQAGVGTQTDVLRSQTELTRAEVNQLNAILGYNRSLVQLQRAISNLPDSTLAEAP